jgi:hypothetical protein
VALTQRVLADNTILREMGTYIDISSGDESDEEREMALTECAIAMWRKPPFQPGTGRIPAGYLKLTLLLASAQNKTQ